MSESFISLSIPLFPIVMFWALAVSIPVVPIWLVGGRWLFGVDLGFVAGLLLWTAAPVFVVYHIAIFITGYCKFDSSPRYLSTTASILEVSYLSSHVFFQMFVKDGGDWGTHKSAVQRWFGWSDEITLWSSLLLAVTTVVLAVALGLAVVTMDPVRPYDSERESLTQRSVN